MTDIGIVTELGPILLLVQMCSSRKYPYFPHRRDWNFLGGGGSVRPKNLKKCAKLNWNFQRVGGRWGRALEKIPSMGEVLVFSGITHFIMSVGTKVEANN